MRRNAFGDPQPASHNELVEALDELNINPATAMVTICDGSDTEDEPFNGWTAEIIGEDDQQIGTVAWSSKEDLIRDLEAAGLTSIEEI